MVKYLSELIGRMKGEGQPLYSLSEGETWFDAVLGITVLRNTLVNQEVTLNLRQQGISFDQGVLDADIIDIAARTPEEAKRKLATYRESIENAYGLEIDMNVIRIRKCKAVTGGNPGPFLL